MANFPTSLDSLSNPGANDTLAAVPHHTQHGTINDIGEALEAKVGIGSSTPVLGKQLRATATGTSKWTGLTEVVIESSGADDQPAIQAVVDAAVVATRIILPDDLYRLYSPVVIDKDNITFVGKAWVNSTTAGAPTRTIIRSIGTWASDRFMFEFDPGPIGPSEQGIFGGGMSGMEIDCYAAGATPHGGLAVLSCRNVLIEDVKVFRPATVGVHLGASAGSSGPYAESTGVTFRSVVSQPVAGIGLYIDTAYICVFDDFHVTMTTTTHTGMEFRGPSDDIWFSHWGVLDQTDVGVHIRFIGNTRGAPSGYVFGPGDLQGGTGTVEGSSGNVATVSSEMETSDSSAPFSIVFLPLGTIDTKIKFTGIEGAKPWFMDIDGNSNFKPSSTVLTIRDDFLRGGLTSGDIGEIGWTVGLQNTAQFTRLASVSGHPGIHRMVLSTVAQPTSVLLSLGDPTVAGFVDPQSTFDVEFVVRWQDDSALKNTYVRMGLGIVTLGSAPTRGLYWERTAQETYWFGEAIDGSGSMRDAAVIVALDTWQRFRIRRNDSGRIWYNIGDSVNLYSGTYTDTNCPTELLTPFIQFGNTTVEGSNKWLDVDFFQLHVKGLNR